MASNLITPVTTTHHRLPNKRRPQPAAPPNIWRNRPFCRLWFGETISLFGTEITALALPLTALLALKATAFDIGILDALAWLPYLLFSLACGVWVDHCRRRPLIIVTNLVRAGIVVLIPLAWLSHRLTFSLLAAVALSTGMLSVVFNLAYQAYVPALLPQEQILDGNSKLQLSASSAKIAGPGIAGFLIQAFSAPLALVIDAVSFGIAGLSVLGIRKPESPPQVSAQRRSLWHEIQEGWHYTFSQPHLRAMTGMASTYNLAEQVLLTLWIVYASKQGVTPAWMGGSLPLAVAAHSSDRSLPIR